MDIEIGSEIEICQVFNFPTQTVTVTGIRLLVDDKSIKSIVTITDSDGDVSTMGAIQLARFVETAAQRYRK